MHTSSSRSKVRFDDRVRVKNIKPEGKGAPVSGVVEDFDFDDDGEDIDFDGDEDGEDIDFDLDENEAEVEEGRATIERLKDDLFAEEDIPDSSKANHTHLGASFTT